MTHSLDALLRRNYRVLLSVVIAALTLLAWTNRFMQDDAFISFRYAQNLAQGHGLVWNIGEPIEGYTNFLWVLLMALASKLGVDPVRASQAAGLCLFAGTLAVTALLIREIVDAAGAALVGILLLGTNYTFSIYATGGLETQLQVFLDVSVAYLAAAAVRREAWSSKELVGLSLTMAAALLTRLDSGIPCGIATLWCLAAWRRSAAKEIARRAALLGLPLALVVGSWLSWKLWYYGDLLPNSFRLKGSSAGFRSGVGYVRGFAASYLLHPVLLVALGLSVRFVRSATRTLWMLLAMTSTWIAYAVSVGGDFMEFRFMVPALALGAPIGVWLVSKTHWILRILVVLLLAYGSLHHAMTYQTGVTPGVESRATLQGHLFDSSEQWVKIGQVLGEAFGHDPEIRIAVTAAGAIPYYSQLTTIDMLGVSDRFVATHGTIIGRRPGHARIAPLSYLRERGVHLVISQPIVVPIASSTYDAPFLPRGEGEPALDAPLIEIPLDAESKLIVWYLVPNSKIDAAIERHHWKVSRVVAGGRAGRPDGELDDPAARRSRDRAFARTTLHRRA